jgi:hypothetical protein
MDVAPDPNDLRAGRMRIDPYELVSRASLIVTWLRDLDGRVSAWAGSLEPGSGLIAKPFIRVLEEGRSAEVGICFCSPSADEFDRITAKVAMLAQEEVLSDALDPLYVQVLRRHEAALSILRSLQDAVRSWREADEVAPAADRVNTTIDDGSLEHE